MSKPRIVKDYEKLEENIQEQIKLKYPYGFDRHLITFKNMEGKFVSALPFETDDRYYLVRMTKIEAREIIEEDEDYNDDGVLKKTVREEYEEKYDEAPIDEVDLGGDDDDFDDSDDEEDDGFEDDD